MTRTLRAMLAAVAIVAMGAAMVLLPINRWLLALVTWIRHAGAAGVAVYIVTYVIAASSLAPGAIISAAAGFLYGPFWGVLLASPTSCLGATLAFLLGRYVFRERVRERVAKSAAFAAIDRAVGENGFKIVVLVRMSPLLPFSLLNYVLSATSIRLRSFSAGSLIGMLPGTCLYVYIGSLVSDAGELVSGTRPGTGGWQQALYWVGLAATILVTVVVTRVARRALSREMGDVADPEALEEA